jgi:hypothetical protein
LTDVIAYIILGAVLIGIALLTILAVIVGVFSLKFIWQLLTGRERF